jgi:lysozyme
MARKPLNPQTSRRPGRKSLASIGVGLVAAALLYVTVPAEESGRTVEATIDRGRVVAVHKSGPQHLKAYRDIVRVWTICDGDTLDVAPGMVETPEGCRERLEDQLVAHAEPVLACVPALRAPERQHQLAASVSLAYNIGPAGFCRSTAARLFNAGRWRDGCEAFLRFNRAGGRVIRGLTLRRQRERSICLRGLPA